MIEWFLGVSLQTRVEIWVWGAMVLSLIFALFKSERTFFDIKRPLESFAVVYVGMLVLFLVSGGFLLTVGKVTAVLVGVSTDAG